MPRAFATLIIVVLGAGRLLAAGEPEITVQASRNQIYEGQSIVYQIQVGNVEDPPAPELKGFDDFDVATLGQRSLNSSQILIINGQRIDNSQYGRQYQYRLTPRRTGTLLIPAPSVTVAGKRLVGRPIVLRVLPAAQQDTALLEIHADRASLYPTQSLTVTLSVFVKPLPDPYGQRDPCDALSRPPMLQIPWALDEKLPAELAPAVPWRQWLGPWENPRGQGFSINNLAQDSVFALIDDRPISFHPPPHRTPRRDNAGREMLYWQYDFPRTFTAKKPGKVGLGPVALEGVFATRREDDRLSGEEIYARGKPLEIAVKDVPTQGRPDTYIGVIGRFQLSADLAPARARVGDPMTLTLAVSGRGALETAFAPDLAKVPGLAQRFKIYEATQDLKGDVCRFTYSLRPLVEGKEPFPPVAIAYFDGEAERYVTLQSEPIPLEVTKADRLAGEQIVATTAGPAHHKTELESRREGIYANLTDDSEVCDEAVRPERWLLGLGGLGGVYLGAILLIGRVRRLAADPALRRRRGAAAKARARLRRAMADLDGGRLRPAADQIQAALAGLVADWANRSAAGLTPRDLCRQLEVWELDPSLIDRLRRLLESCEAAQYGAVDAALDQWARQSQELFDALVYELKRGGGKRP